MLIAKKALRENGEMELRYHVSIQHEKLGDYKDSSTTFQNLAVQNIFKVVIETCPCLLPFFTGVCSCHLQSGMLVIGTDLSYFNDQSGDMAELMPYLAKCFVLSCLVLHSKLL